MKFCSIAVFAPLIATASPAFAAMDPGLCNKIRNGELRHFRINGRMDDMTIDKQGRLIHRISTSRGPLTITFDHGLPIAAQTMEDTGPGSLGKKTDVRDFQKNILDIVSSNGRQALTCKAATYAGGSLLSQWAYACEIDVRDTSYDVDGCAIAAKDIVLTLFPEQGQPAFRKEHLVYSPQARLTLHHETFNVYAGDDGRMREFRAYDEAIKTIVDLGG